MWFDVYTISPNDYMLHCKTKVTCYALCELSLLFNIKEGVEEQFPEVRENSPYEKLWNHLDKRELRDFGLTNVVFSHKCWLLWANIITIFTIRLPRYNTCPSSRHPRSEKALGPSAQLRKTPRFTFIAKVQSEI